MIYPATMKNVAELKLSLLEPDNLLAYQSAIEDHSKLHMYYVWRGNKQQWYTNDIVRLWSVVTERQKRIAKERRLQVRIDRDKQEAREKVIQRAVLELWDRISDGDLPIVYRRALEYFAKYDHPNYKTLFAQDGSMLPNVLDTVRVFSVLPDQLLCRWENDKQLQKMVSFSKLIFELVLIYQTESMDEKQRINNHIERNFERARSGILRKWS